MSSYQTKVTDEKRERVETLQQKVGNSQQYIFTDYRGANVQDMTEFRRQLRAQNVDYLVVKNRMLRIVFRSIGLADLDDLIVGPTALAVIRDENPVDGIKTIVRESAVAKIVIKGGYLFDGTVTKSEVEQVAKLPSRDELLAKLMGGMQAPLQNFAGALRNIMQRVVMVLQAIADKQK